MQAQVEKRRDLGKKYVQDSSRARHSIANDKEEEHVVLDDVDTPTDDELSSGSLPNLSLEKRSSDRSCQRHSHRPSFSNADNGTFRSTRREIGQGKNQPNEAPEKASTLPTDIMSPMMPVYTTSDTGPMLYIPPATMIQSPDDMLSSPLRHILDYEPPRGFFIPTFTMFDDFTDPYDHVLHNNQAMTLNADNDLLLCEVFPASLRVNTFYELWGAFIS